MRTRGDVDVARGIEIVLRSRLFHGAECRTKHVKSPVALALGALRAIEAFAPPPDLADLEIHLTRMGQRLFYPPNVAGWPGGLAWLRGSTVLARASFAAWLTDSSPGLGTDHFLSLAKRRCGGRPEAWLDTLVVLLCGAEISPQTKKEILAAAQSEDKPGRQYGRILSRLLTLPELQLG